MEENKYIFYYLYKDEIYGVLTHDNTKGVLRVCLIRKNEKENIKAEWLSHKILTEEIKISKSIN